MRSGQSSMAGLSLVSHTSSIDVQSHIRQAMETCNVLASNFRPLSMAEMAQILKHDGFLLVLPSNVGLLVAQNKKVKSSQAIKIGHKFQSSQMEKQSVRAFPSDCAWPRTASELVLAFFPEVNRLLHTYFASVSPSEDPAEQNFRAEISIIYWVSKPLSPSCVTPTLLHGHISPSTL